MQKVERLMDLFEKYKLRVAKATNKIEAEFRSGLLPGEELDSEDEEEIYMAKLDSGLFTLQLLCYIIAIVSAADTEVILHSSPSFSFAALLLY
jgi:beta-catenin-like protein 1